MKKLFSLFLAGAMILSLGACQEKNSPGGAQQGVTDTQADKGMAVMGNTVKYDPNHLVNDGQPISIDWWVWASEDMFQGIADMYEEIHPNVTINIINNPWDGFFTKLPLSLQKGEDGPTLFNVHNSYENLIFNYMAPFDIDTQELIADYPSAASHLKDGKIYYADYGLSTGMVYYNKEIWEAEGLTTEDIPTTWMNLLKLLRNSPNLMKTAK